MCVASSNCSSQLMEAFVLQGLYPAPRSVMLYKYKWTLALIVVDWIVSWNCEAAFEMLPTSRGVGAVFTGSF